MVVTAAVVEPKEVIMNGVDVTDVSRNYTSEEWEKLKQVGGHTYVYQRRDFLSGRSAPMEVARGRDGGRKRDAIKPASMVGRWWADAVLLRRRLENQIVEYTAASRFCVRTPRNHPHLIVVPRTVHVLDHVVTRLEWHPQRQ
jgi:hypothetical protein